MSSSSSNPSAVDVAWDEADTLISILRTWGIDYLVGTTRPLHPGDVARDLHSAVMLVKRLAQCEHPRVRDASISLFLLHPELSHAIIEALQNDAVRRPLCRCASIALAHVLVSCSYDRGEKQYFSITGAPCDAKTKSYHL
ncbi:MAG: hypothetical protein JO202_10880 [Ktedonobacteraceae bacterium]|nr:hypothetical protein [Ktedonobacteraceae bacterium]